MNKFLIVFMVFVLCSVNVSAELNNGSWAKYGQNINNTGLSPYEGISTGVERWVFNAGNPFYYYNGVAIDNNDILYVGNGDNGYLYSIYRNGTENWRYITGDFITTTPLIDENNNIIFGSWNGDFYSLYPNGSLNWVTNIGGSIEGGSASIDNDIIYQATATGTKALYALDINNGSEIWNFTTAPSGIASTPVIDNDGIIYFGSNDDKLYALYNNGSEKWNVTTGVNILDSPMLYNDNIYFGSDKFYALNKNGSELWNYTSYGDIYGSAIDKNGNIYIVGNDANITALYNNGSFRWNYLTSNKILNKPTIDNNGNIYVGNNLGDLTSLYPNGTLKFFWTDIYSNDGFENMISIDSKGTLYFTTWGNRLFALSVDSPTLGNILNSKTNDNNTDFVIGLNDEIIFSVTPDYTIDYYTWFKDGIEIANTGNTLTDNDFYIGDNNISVYGTNLDGISNIVLWNVSGLYTNVDIQMSPLWALVTGLLSGFVSIIKLIMYGVILVLMFAMLAFIAALFKGINK